MKAAPAIASSVVAAFLLSLTAMASCAQAGSEFSIVPGSVEVQTLDSEGNPDVQAGAHPDHLQVTFKLHAAGTSARDLVFEFGPGLGGDLGSVPTCSRAEFAGGGCPADTKVGMLASTREEGEALGGEREPIYNLAPAPGEIASLGVKPFWSMQFGMDLRPSDYGLRLQAKQLPQFPLSAGRVELWGIPADHLSPPSAERVGFLTNPTTCRPLQVTFRTRSWEAEAPWLSETAETAPFAGCQGLQFGPRLGFELDDRTVDSPTGARIDVNADPHDGPDETAASAIEDVRVALPQGVTISAGGSEGLETCSDQQFGLGSEAPAACPFHSQVGSVEIVTPQFGEPVVGSIYLGEERPNERFRLLVGAVLRGIRVKFSGRLIADPQTGQLTAVLENLPQLSVSHIVLNLNGGSGALLATPLACGPATASGRFVPYSGGATVESAVSVEIAGKGGAACPANLPFGPSLVAGSAQAMAGQDTDFLLTMTRQDGEQLVRRFSMTLPSGVSPALGGVDLCSGGAAASASCPAGSRIGSAEAEIGSGATPALVRGDVYLTEAYERAPFGVAMVFRAAVGPFDLGTVSVRGTLRVDRRTGRATLSTDPLPSVVEGIPLRFRTVAIDLNRQGFLRNPTSCKPDAAASTVYASDGRSVSASSPFAVRGCGRLGFEPRLGSTLIDRKEIHRDGHPGLRLAAQMAPGGTNLRGFRLKLPRILSFRGGGIQAICARGDAADGICPKEAQVGSAVVRTPLMAKPLRGPIYLVQPEGDGLPGLWSSVGASGVTIDVAGRTLRRQGRLVTEIVDLPDMPFERFAMRLDGGKHGLFSLRSGVCPSGHFRRLLSPFAAAGQDGAYRLGRVRLGAKAPCAGRAERRVKRHVNHTRRAP